MYFEGKYFNQTTARGYMIPIGGLENLMHKKQKPISQRDKFQNSHLPKKQLLVSW